MKSKPHVRSLQISECAAKMIAWNGLWPGAFACYLVDEADRRASVSYCRGKRPPLVWAHLRRQKGLHRGRFDKAAYGKKPRRYQNFSYRWGMDRFPLQVLNDKYHYREASNGRVILALFTSWLPEVICAAIGANNERLNDIVEDEGYFFHVVNPRVTRARNGLHLGRRAVILSLQVNFSADYWEEACP